MTPPADWRAERAALADRLRATMPAAMRERQQWLLWRLVQVPGRPKPAKTPFYLNGHLRGWPKGRPRDGQPTAAMPHAELGDELDRAALASLDAVCERIQQSREFDGVGFAFLEGDGLIGIDLDWKESKEPTAEQQAIMECCPSFAEWSPSGLGVHIIVAGQCDSFKSDAAGVEVYCGGRYFTCTGQRLESAPAEVAPVKPYALAYMQSVVEAAKAAAKALRQAGDELSAVPVPSRPVQSPARAHAGGDDFRRVNDEALRHLDSWVPQLFPKARRAPYGWRVTSKDLGRDLQEDLQLSPDGIMDFGEERGMSAIDCVLQWSPGMGGSAKEAMLWLADRCGIQVQRRAARPPAAPSPAPAAARRDAQARAEPTDEEWDEAVADALRGPGAEAADLALAEMRGDDTPAAGEGAAGAGSSEAAGGGGDAAAGGAGGRGGRRKVYPPEFWDQIDRMLDRYALVYGSSQVWDEEKAKFLEVSALRLMWGNVPVQFWLASPRRRVVDPEDLVFEPGLDVPEGKVNLFRGIPVEPVVCTDEEVAPMLRLLRHLCGASVLVSQADEDGEAGSADAARGDDVDAVMHWVLCWLAYPHQHIGAKMRTALVFHGSQGTGKNLFFDCWRDTFGDMGRTVGQTELEEKYNLWLSRALAIVADEVVSKLELYHNKNRLKLIVTQEHKFPIRAMNADTRWESNHANVVFTSNEDLPLALEDRDRRYLVVYTPLEADASLYDEVRSFLCDNGVGKWLHYLQRYPLGDFDRHTKPLLTRAKQALIEANWRPSQRFVAEWIGGYLDLPKRVCSREQLFRAFRRWVDMTGVRWASDQSTFVREINRWANEQRVRDSSGRLRPAPFELRKVRLPEGSTEKEAGDRRFLWMVIHDGTGPNEGVGMGDWALDAIRTFGTALNRFCGHTGRPAGDSAGAGE